MSDLLFEQNPLERIADYLQAYVEGRGGEEGGETPQFPIPILDMIHTEGGEILIEFPTDHTGSMVNYCLMRIAPPPNIEAPTLYIPGHIDWDDENKEGFLVVTEDYTI